MTATTLEPVTGTVGDFMPSYLGPTLGELVIMSLKEATRVPFAELEEKWALHGIDLGRRIPKEANPKDAFRGATPKGIRRDGFTFMPYEGTARLPDMVDACVLVESTDDETRVEKRHKNLGVVYLTDRNMIAFESVYKFDRAIDLHIERLTQRFERNLVSANARQIRGMLQRALELACKVTYHDGCYLVPVTQTRLLDGLGEFMTWLNGYAEGQTQKWIRIPYADTPLQRADLRMMLDEEIQTNVERIIGQAQEHINTAKNPHKVTATGNKAITLLGELTELEARLREYQGVLGDKLLDINNYLGVKRMLVQNILQMPNGQMPASPSTP